MNLLWHFTLLHFLVGDFYVCSSTARYAASNAAKNCNGEVCFAKNTKVFLLCMKRLALYFTDDKPQT
jgi:hypothetical protein